MLCAILHSMAAANLTPLKDNNAGRKLFMNIKVGKKAIAEATEKLKNW